jgi:hypothetical protein
MKNIAGAIWFGLMFAVPSETDAQAIIMHNQQAVMNERDRQASAVYNIRLQE